MDNRIKLIVVNQNVLGYIFPEHPETYHILQASVLRGANVGLNASSLPIKPSDKIRLATEEDFEDFKVHFEGYQKPEEYVWDDGSKMPIIQTTKSAFTKIENHQSISGFKFNDSYFNPEYYCLTCGNFGHSDPETSFCHCCGEDNWKKT